MLKSLDPVYLVVQEILPLPKPKPYVPFWPDFEAVPREATPQLIEI